MSILRKLLLPLAATLIMPMASQAKEVVDFYVDYSKFTEFPYYVMGYTPTFEDGVMKSSSPGNWYQYFIADGVPTTIGGTYTVSAMVKSSKAGQFNVNMGWGWGEGQSTGAQLTVSTDWEVQSATYTVGAESCNVVAQPGGFDGELQWKWVKVWHDDPSLDDANLCLALTNMAETTQPWEMQLNYEPTTPIEPGEYLFSCDACGSANGSFAIWGEKIDGSAIYGPVINFTTEWASYHQHITLDGGAKQLNLCFGGKHSGDFYIDNIVIKRIEDGVSENKVSNYDFAEAQYGFWKNKYNHSYSLSIAPAPQDGIRSSNPRALWRGSAETNWGVPFGLDRKFFQAAAPGDRIVIWYGSEGASLHIMLGGWDGLNIATYEAGKYDFLTVNSSAKYIVYELTDQHYSFVKELENGPKTYTAIDDLKNGGLLMQGPATVVGVDYIPANAFTAFKSNLYNFTTGSEDEGYSVINAKLHDAHVYANSMEIEAASLSYNREFPSDNCQALFVPFDMDYSVWSQYGEVAELTAFEKKDDAYVLRWTTLTSGKLTPNKPYIFLPNEAGKVEFKCQDATIMPADYEPAKYTFTAEDGAKVTISGTYATKADMGDGKTYALANGAFYRSTSDEKTLKPFRIYLTVDAAPSAQGMPMKIVNSIDDELQGIDSLIIDENEAEGETYDLMGRKVVNPAPGIYVRNGKTIIVK